ncbi:hypothetical protein [Microbacterium sp. CPCC 204701]|uniref:hypothetical protein n=1 Tax=Microbacterium sp. CPCC 204701 TaxID=2493084 RepID=UPI000FDB93ED|nr:hypothetical protein [Microbacterium sp. CPCC 204701]
MILVVGVFLIPTALSVIFNSYSAPDAAADVRMAFAQVTGATIAIITVLGLLAHRIVRRSLRPTRERRRPPRPQLT